MNRGFKLRPTLPLTNTVVRKQNNIYILRGSLAAVSKMQNDL